MYFGPTAHLLRVSLRYVEPEVWRRLTVPSDMSLPKFAKVLEQAMGWEGYHLHLFDVGGVLFGQPDEDTDDVINEKAAKVSHLLPRVESSLRWDYDFGDGWEHDVVVEALEPLDAGNKKPVVLDGARACPPEDVGGPSGYEDLVRALSNPKSRAHKQMKGWAPEGFDPAAFDAADANRRISGR